MLLVQSRHAELVLLPAQQAAMTVLHGLHAERDMGPIVEVGAAPVAPGAGLHLLIVVEMYPWLHRQRNYSGFSCIVHRPQNRSVRHQNYTTTSALMPSGAALPLRLVMHPTCRIGLTAMLCVCRILVAAGAMQALIAAADAHEGPPETSLPEELGRTLVAIAAALETTEKFPLKEAIDAADLWAAQTGIVRWQHTPCVMHD